MAFNAEVKKYKEKDVINLKAGNYVATIAPFLGSNIISMVDLENDISFFRKDENLSIEELKGSPEVYGFPTLFYPNRLKDGILKCSDYTYTFPIEDHEGHNSLHGFLHKREHSIVEATATDDAAIAKTSYIYDEKDPFFETFPVSFKAEYTFKLTEKGMYYEVTITNLSERQLPYGICNHTAINAPFTTNGEPLDTRIFITIGDKWPLNQRNLPTCDFISLDNHDRQYLTGSMIPVKHVICNDVYNAETYEIEGEPFRGAIISDTASGKEIRYEIDDNFKFWIIWNDGGEKGYFCPEPSTWMIDAPNLPLPGEESGYIELATGESKTVGQHFYSYIK
ncbi:MAG: aldose 1-epimerase [Eubacterium sp.]|nr:aldose 1-epimerase [Eubacterium sp.]